MPVYTYKATDQSGKLVTGTVISRSRRDIAGVLDERGLKLLASKESRGPIGHFALRCIPLKEKISLCRYLSLIINSGISLGEGLDLLSTGTINKTLRTVIQEVASSTRRGRPLHESFARYPQHFDTVFLTMFEAESDERIAVPDDYHRTHGGGRRADVYVCSAAPVIGV